MRIIINNKNPQIEILFGDLISIMPGKQQVRFMVSLV